MAGVEGRVVDYGAGDGQVTQKLHDMLGLDIDGYDVRLYPAPNVTIPMATFDGGHVNVPDGSYEAAVMTNVAHHERNNEIILQELSRIVKTQAGYHRNYSDRRDARGGGKGSREDFYE